MDSEMMVMRAAGLSQLQLARPAIILAVAVTVGIYAISLYFLPLSFRNFKDLQNEFRNDFSAVRSEEHTSELQSLMRISYAVFCLNKQKKDQHTTTILHEK